MLNKNEFLVLTEIEKHKEKLTQRAISLKIGLSVGLVNKIVNSLIEKKLLLDMLITQKGYEELEPYKVKRAIFIAAGFGSRMVPITFNTPKPLVRVHGVRIIDTLLDAVVAAGIEEIIIVRGYLGEQFDVLQKKYSNIKFVENTKFNDCNNISSAVVVADLFKRAYVFDADLVLSNKNLITKYQYCSNYLGIYKEVTDDWCFNVNKSSLEITKMGIGGEDCYQMVGISYWNDEAGEKLKEDIQKVFNSPGGKERYWDQVPLEFCKKNYKVYVRPCEQADIIEIDSFNELKAIDKTYDV